MKHSIEWSFRPSWQAILLIGFLFIALPWWVGTIAFFVYVYATFEVCHVITDEDGNELERSRTKALGEAYEKVRDAQK